jgi:hypothetical protein
MRVGFNPHRNKPIEEIYFSHQVIIPVYIPNQEGYFKDSLRIFQMCVQSLLNTIHIKTFVTIVNNGSCADVTQYLNELQADEKIHELIHTENIGKLNAVLKGVVGNTIELVTIADADVLFLKDWQKETLAVYNNFPKAGVVGVVPQFRNFSHLCGNIILEKLFSKKLRFTTVKNPEALKKFNASIGANDDYNKAYLKWNLTIEKNSHLAIVGSGHFVATYRRELFSQLKTYLAFKLGGDSERYFDELPLKKGLWRMTTNDNFAYHMGNVLEDWMEAETNKKSKVAEPVNLKFTVDDENISKAVYLLKNKIFVRFFKMRKIRNLFYRLKGLPANEIKKY